MFLNVFIREIFRGCHIVKVPPMPFSVEKNQLRFAETQKRFV
jgi:hypothetical protein